MAPYTCAHCGGTFESGWSDEEAAAEARENFGQDPAHEPMVQVCDPCYKRMVAWKSPSAWMAEQRRKA